MAPRSHLKVCLCSNYKADASTAILNNLNYQLNKFDKKVLPIIQYHNPPHKLPLFLDRSGSLNLKYTAVNLINKPLLCCFCFIHMSKSDGFYWDHAVNK